MDSIYVPPGIICTDHCRFLAKFNHKAEYLRNRVRSRSYRSYTCSFWGFLSQLFHPNNWFFMMLIMAKWIFCISRSGQALDMQRSIWSIYMYIMHFNQFRGIRFCVEVPLLFVILIFICFPFWYLSIPILDFLTEFVEDSLTN